MLVQNFNKIVKILSKKGGKVLLKGDIFEFIDPECKPEYQTLLNKILYRLRAEGHIISLKAGVYIIPEREDLDLNSVDLLEKYYLKLLKKYITQTVGSNYYISGLKSLQFHMKDYSLPDKIFIINRSVNKKIKVGSYEIIFKTLSGNYQNKKINLYARFSKYTKNIEIGDITLKSSSLELAILESALVNESYEGVQIGILTKAIKKYGKVLDHDVFEEIAKYKYNMSLNRLKELTRTIHPELSQLFLRLIKQNGGCFVGEGLRGF